MKLVALLALAAITPLAAVEDQVTNTQCFARTAAFVASVMDRHFVACNQSAEQLGQFLQDSTNSLLAECAAGSEPLRVNDSAFNISSAQYDVVLFPSNFLGDLGVAGALASLLPFIDGDVQQVSES
ncbi:hypothetical protein QJQ45_018806 [Haematococcus lacustris]|nr:hypothetical protein QJQ45_018806 [Haematococcus lacustris]